MENKTTHTSEPWTYSQDGIWGPRGTIIANMVHTAYEPEKSQVVANAIRIVACVNACAGINPEAMQDLLVALQDLLYCNCSGPKAKGREVLP